VSDIDIDDPRHPWSSLPEHQKERLRFDQPAIEEIARRFPDLPPVTQIVMGGDLGSMRYWRSQYQKGEVDAEKAIHLTGSYFRWNLACEMLSQHLVEPSWFDSEVCDLWRGSDPDDTDPANLTIWRGVASRNGGYVRDGRPLPRGSRVVVFRGGWPVVEPGIAWTTDPKIASKFARGAGLRVNASGGQVARGSVARQDVLAYITGRGESEVIVDPRLVRVATGDDK
jgi:hypothetical protein